MYCQVVQPFSLTTTKWNMEQQEQQPVIPELWIIREIVRRHMPEGHTLKGVDLSFGSLEENQDPRFLILIELQQRTPAPEPFGWADKMTKVIRQRWPGDDFYVKVKILAA
jgi:hypothetical protein